MDSRPEIQQKIIRYVIKNTPFGETKEVVKDLCKIISQLNPQEEVILKALKEHNEDHLAVFKRDGDAKDYIVSSILNAQDDIYVDQQKGLSIKVDHAGLTIVSSNNVDLPKNTKLDAFRYSMNYHRLGCHRVINESLFELLIQRTISRFLWYKQINILVIYTGDENDFQFYVGLTAKNINLPNFYTGDWVSKWEVTKSEIKGELLVQAHYYEEGNVQLKNSNKFTEGLHLNLNDAFESAKSVVDAIAKLENRHQEAMDKIYENMPELFFKAMRRILPITGTKMDWNIHAHKVASSLKQQ